MEPETLTTTRNVLMLWLRDAFSPPRTRLQFLCAGNSTAGSAGFNGRAAFLKASVFRGSCQVGLFGSYTLQRRARIWALANAAHVGNEEGQLGAGLLLVQGLTGSSAGLFLAYSL